MASTTKTKTNTKPAKKSLSSKDQKNRTPRKVSGRKAPGAAAQAVPKSSGAKTATAQKTPMRKSPAPIVSTGYWLFKSEPDAFSWDALKAKGSKGEQWDGVRNYLARNNMRAMQLGDLGFFYHSNVGLEVVGICEVCALAHPDSTTDDPRWECVDVRAVMDMPTPVSLKDVKSNPRLKDMSLVTSMRLSVQPVTADEWAEVCRMGNLDPKKIKRPK